jgi:hypothetical protein
MGRTIPPFVECDGYRVDVREAENARRAVPVSRPRTPAERPLARDHVTGLQPAHPTHTRPYHEASVVEGARRSWCRSRVHGLRAYERRCDGAGAMVQMMHWAGAILATLCLTIPTASATRVATDSDHDDLSNAFETTWSHTDPTRADTNGDGLLNPAEDPDGDGLSNLWEQRLGLDPLRRDSDGNGVPDGAEDPDGDRIPSAVEVRWGITDPRLGDTDGDGIRDGAEDPDGDGLSNAGEARYGLDPLLADSDGNGISDWHEDSDHDGRVNGREQDQRPIPRDLTPTLAGAESDRPRSYFDGCHVNHGATPRVCLYGVTNASRSILLFGDSHAAQWLPALEDIATRRGWRIVSVTKSSCPVAAVTVNHLGSRYIECDVWRRRALDRIAQLHPTLLVAASLDAYPLFDARGVVPGRRFADVWRRGLAKTLRRLKSSAHRVVLIGDTPRQRMDVVACLRRHQDDISACVTASSRAVHEDHNAIDMEAANAAYVRYAPTAPVLCPYDPCPVVIDRWLIDFDNGHMNATYSRKLGPALERLILPGTS